MDRGNLRGGATAQTISGERREVPELRRGTVREVIHGSYRIIYRVEPERVAVLTVRHSRQLTGPEDIPL
jgi:plasmid stabilization system protein ParE